MNHTHDLREQERMVGDTFDNFIKLNGGNKALAALYWGRAYWNARGIKKYDLAYDRKIERLERKKHPKATDLAEAR